MHAQLRRMHVRPVCLHRSRRMQAWPHQKCTEQVQLHSMSASPHQQCSMHVQQGCQRPQGLPAWGGSTCGSVSDRLGNPWGQKVTGSCEIHVADLRARWQLEIQGKVGLIRECRECWECDWGLKDLWRPTPRRNLECSVLTKGSSWSDARGVSPDESQ